MGSAFPHMGGISLLRCLAKKILMWAGIKENVLRGTWKIICIVSRDVLEDVVNRKTDLFSLFALPQF